MIHWFQVCDVVEALLDITTPGFGNEGTTIFKGTRGIVEKILRSEGNLRVSWELGSSQTISFVVAEAGVKAIG